MNWLDKLERRFGNLYIPNLMTGVVLVQGVVWLLQALTHQYWITQLFSLSRAGVLQGQVWRLFTFILLPGSFSSPIFLAISLYFYYFVGSALERQWGSFRFNLYLLAGMMGSWAAAFLAGSWGNGGILLSLFLAFAWLYPNMQVLLFFIIPLKVKWLGLFSAALWLLDLLRYPGLFKLCLVFEMAGFLLFFGRDVWDEARRWFTNRRRRDQWNNNYRR